MIPTQALFEAHLTVVNLERAMRFYGELLGLRLAAKFEAPKAAFYWIGGRGQSMLGVWEVGGGPQRMSLHVAFKVGLEDVLKAPERLRTANVQPLDIMRNPTEEAVVIGWMPAAVVYFSDPDGNLLEYLAMLPEEPRSEVGVVGWSEWKRITSHG